MDLPLEIIIDHHEPVSMDAVRQAISTICKASEETSLKFLRSDRISRLDIPQDFLYTVEAHLIELSKDSLWLESVEQGSSKFKGFFTSVLLPIILLAGHDMVKDEDWYINFIDETEQAIVETWEDSERFIGDLAEHIHIQSLKHSKDDRQGFEYEIINGRVRITVTPSQKQKNRPNPNKKPPSLEA